MANHGTTTLALTSEDDSLKTGCTLNLTDSTRALHSCTQMADQGNDILMSRTQAVVVPEGMVDRVLAIMAKEGKKIRATYPRRGGLYVARVRARPGVRPSARSAAPRPAANGPQQPHKKVAGKPNSGFARRGGQR